jgi:hypothetical protein
MIKKLHLLGSILGAMMFTDLPSIGSSGRYYRSSRVERKIPLTKKQKKARAKSMRAKKARRKQRKSNK